MGNVFFRVLCFSFSVILLWRVIYIFVHTMKINGVNVVLNHTDFWWMKNLWKNIFYVLQGAKSHSGLERHEGEQIITELSFFRGSCPFKGQSKDLHVWSMVWHGPIHPVRFIYISLCSPHWAYFITRTVFIWQKRKNITTSGTYRICAQRSHRGQKYLF